MTGRVNLEVLGATGGGCGPGEVARVLHLAGLADVAARKVKTYSQGMRQRLGIAAAMLGRPSLLIIDEPTNGLDPAGIREIRGLLRGLAAEGTTVFLSSHLLAEVEALCTRVGVLDRGRLVVQDELAALQAPTGRVLVRTPDAAIAVGVLDGRIESRTPGEHGELLVVRYADAADLTRLLVGAGVRIDELRPQHHTLEDTVLALSGPGSDVVSRRPGRRGHQHEPPS
jgi:ABC-2 type transport system ATP-binding protein